MRYNMIEKCYTDENGELKVEMSKEAARDICIVIESYREGYYEQSRSNCDSDERDSALGEYIAYNFLSSEEEEYVANIGYLKFCEVVEAKARKLIGY